ncbi:electron transfer flavoprotein subunit beta/FixA family protein [Methylacidimicrobium tartarophylax]|uniref:Caffeyl-CoA reductase-Etf complex subunit CarD n=1 Tax=Methylacidimicrobium tartarophylax TaxID=1041768 RepID=A0A5E6MCI6_9BACT|nr:electron transfer flavoprotein subunit beta/FixA family protein [Methylacidimicrobium tartarophylax]VVM06045.1 Caffeyl-CoA reductase-Etf complex subunit CarD [Methylacidimicrobium tartarophylax]
MRGPNIVVCVKQVPDSAQIRVHPVTGTIMRQGVPAVLNPYDLFALEEALQIKDRLGGRIVALCMGPPQAEAALRKALSLGVDDAVLVSDRAFAGSDTLATSFALASAIRQVGQEQPVDLVFTGKQTIDGDTGQVGPGVAKRLGMQLLSYVCRIPILDMDSQSIVVHRWTEKGVQVLKSKLPCLITVLEGTSEGRFASLPEMIRAARQPIRVWNRQAAGIEDLSKIGLKGSPTVVGKVFAPSRRAERAECIEWEQDQAEKAVSLLWEKIRARQPELVEKLSGDNGGENGQERVSE